MATSIGSKAFYPMVLIFSAALEFFNSRERKNKDPIEGKVKDVAGRVERQTGEWTGSGCEEPTAFTVFAAQCPSGTLVEV